MKKFIVKDEFWDLFPEATLGVLVLNNVEEDKELSEDELNEIKKLLNSSNEIAKKYVPNDVISENDVVKVWREAYSKFPTKKGARCSLENLLKRVLHDNPVGTITPSVDITNSISLKYAFPIGAEDIDKIDGDIRLDIMEGNEKFIPLGSEEEDPPLNGELAYADDYGYSVEEQISAPYIVQLEGIFGYHQRYTHDFIAVSDVNFITIDKEELVRLSEDFLVFRLNILNSFATQVQKHFHQTWLRQPLTLRERIIRFLVQHCVYPAGHKQFNILMNRLADELNDSRLNISHELNLMQHDGLISLSRGKINIPQLERLLSVRP